MFLEVLFYFIYYMLIF